jgi:hypothetical protein
MAKTRSGLSNPNPAPKIYSVNIHQWRKNYDNTKTN